MFKKVHFWLSFTQKYLNTIFGKKGTFLSNTTWGSIWLPDTDLFGLFIDLRSKIFAGTQQII